MRVMGIDSSMRATGWLVMDVDEKVLTPFGTPHLSHPLMHRVQGGTVNYSDTSEARLDRIIQNCRMVHQITDKYAPEIVVIEGCLDKGESRSTTGMAVYTMIVAPWHPKGDKNQVTHVPRVVISISPERLQSLAHGKRTTTGTEVVRRFKSLSPDVPKGRVSEHEADSYFLGYHGLRFWLTKEGVWPKTILTPKEMAVFHDHGIRDPKNNRRLASKSMINEEGMSWWVNNLTETEKLMTGVGISVEKQASTPENTNVENLVLNEDGTECFSDLKEDSLR